MGKANFIKIMAMLVLIGFGVYIGIGVFWINFSLVVVFTLVWSIWSLWFSYW